MGSLSSVSSLALRRGTNYRWLTFSHQRETFPRASAAVWGSVVVDWIDNVMYPILTIGVILHGTTIAPSPSGYAPSGTHGNATNAGTRSSHRRGDQVREVGQTFRVRLEKMLLNSSLAAMNAAGKANTDTDERQERP